MNEHIFNGNRMIGTIKETDDTVSFGTLSGNPTHFRTKEDLKPIINEFSLALEDDLNEVAERIATNRLNELRVGLINIWINWNYR